VNNIDVRMRGSRAFLLKETDRKRRRCIMKEVADKKIEPSHGGSIFG
jgi:hypothetical protein